MQATTGWLPFGQVVGASSHVPSQIGPRERVDLKATKPRALSNIHESVLTSKATKPNPAQGNWSADPARFDGGSLASLGSAAQAAGLEMLVWFEPERVMPDTELASRQVADAPAGLSDGQQTLDSCCEREGLAAVGPRQHRCPRICELGSPRCSKNGA